MTHKDSFGMNFPSINDIHDESLVDHFREGIGRKVFILSPSFPFLFIGQIEEVIEDYVVVAVETTSISQLERRTWHIHIHQIETFFIERENGPKIPELRDDV